MASMMGNGGKLHIDGFIFDLDGTVYLGEEALPGSVEAIAALRRRGKRVLFVSNKPLEPRAAYAARLTRLGIPTAESEVITSAYVLGFHLSRHYPALSYYVIGEGNLRAELCSYGLHIVDELAGQDAKSVIQPHGISAVIVGFDRTLDYRKLNTAYQALRAGARFFATNADKTCPLPGGDIPDAGATIAALEHLSGRTVELVAGKPSLLIAQVGLEMLGLPAACCLMAGDRLETDIRMGQQAGMYTAVVLTGVARRAEAEQLEQPPDLILENLGELPGLVE
jgi:arabinose operon protein AraL